MALGRTERTIDNLLGTNHARACRPWNPPADLLVFGDRLIVDLVRMFEAESSRNLSRIGDLLSKAGLRRSEEHRSHHQGRREADGRGVGNIRLRGSRNGNARAIGVETRNGLTRLRAALSDVYAEMAAYSASVDIADR